LNKTLNKNSFKITTALKISKWQDHSNDIDSYPSFILVRFWTDFFYHLNDCGNVPYLLLIIIKMKETEKTMILLYFEQPFDQKQFQNYKKVYKFKWQDPPKKYKGVSPFIFVSFG
jgi:hypothetical protein